MFWNHGSLFAICRSLVGLYTPKHAMFPLPLPCGGMKEPSLYYLFDGSYLSGFGVKSLCGMGGVRGGLWVMYVVFGAFIHFIDVFIVYGFMVIMDCGWGW